MLVDGLAGRLHDETMATSHIVFHPDKRSIDVIDRKIKRLGVHIAQRFRK